MRNLLKMNRLRFWVLQKSPRFVFRNSITTTSCYLDPIKLKEGPNLKDFLQKGVESPIITKQDLVPYLNPEDLHGNGRKVFFKVYGCQMNVNDTEIVWSILKSVGYSKTEILENADVVLIFTCAIRENAENKIWDLLKSLRGLKKKRLLQKSQMKIGIMGCMAERLKTKLIEQEKSIDLVAGPDSYRDLPRLLALTDTTTAINVALSLDETYADVTPVQLNQDSISAYVSIMRGCDNMCTYCIVPFTRGRERSRPIESIVREVKQLSEAGIKEITLLGQNVNSYRDLSAGKTNTETKLAKGFKTVYKSVKGGIRFAELLDKVANVDSQMRIRFTSPHPKDFPDEVLQVISSHKNVCCNIHLPAQSGNTNVLERMRRGYSREAYLELVERIKTILPNVTLSSDFICGFCGETDEEFSDTLSLIEKVGYHTAYLFAYSMREKTTAHRRFKDDVAPETKQIRLVEMNKLFRKIADSVLSKFVGTNQTILVEGTSKRSDEFLAGRTDGNVKVIIPNKIRIDDSFDSKLITPGDFINVLITNSNSQVLKGVPLHQTRL